MNKDISIRHDVALKKFVERYKKNPNVIAILVSGSYIHSTPDKNSDLDVHIILKKSETRERGNTWINGVEIEYFINPFKQIKKYFESEKKDKSPSTAHMFTNCKILYQKGKELDELIKEAKKIIAKKPPEMKKFEKELARYQIDDQKKDLEDMYLKKDWFAFNIIADDLIKECLKIFYKTKRASKEKSKRLQSQLKKIDFKFEALFSKAIQENNVNKKFYAINQLVEYTEKLIGGKRPKEWRFISKCKI